MHSCVLHSCGVHSCSMWLSIKNFNSDFDRKLRISSKVNLTACTLCNQPFHFIFSNLIKQKLNPKILYYATHCATLLSYSHRSTYCLNKPTFENLRRICIALFHVKYLVIFCNIFAINATAILLRYLLRYLLQYLRRFCVQ